VGARQIEGSSQDSEDRARIREFTNSGYEIAGGGLKESSWSALSRDTAKDELAKSKQILEEITGRPVQFFSYPSTNETLPDVELLENCGYRGACSFEPGLNHFDQNRYLLKRTEVVRKMGRRFFRRILRGFSNDKTTVEKWRSYWSEMSTPTHLSDTTEFYRLYAQELRILFGERPMKRVLEIGCGNGALFPFLGFESCKYKGVDFSPTMLASFRARFPGIELECCEGSSYFDAGNKYDLIFSNGLIQHFDTLMLDHHFACVRSMMDHDSLFVCALIPWQAHRRSWYGGRFSGEGKMSWTKLAKHRVRTALNGDRFGRWYDLRDIAEMARKHGFSVAFHGSIFYMHSFHAVMKLKIMQRCSLSAVIIRLDHGAPDRGPGVS
jgi:SAM-dependent methyltransferase